MDNKNKQKIMHRQIGTQDREEEYKSCGLSDFLPSQKDINKQNNSKIKID